MIMVSLFEDHHTGQICVKNGATAETRAFSSRQEAAQFRRRLALRLLSEGCSVAFHDDRAVPARNLTSGLAWPMVARSGTGRAKESRPRGCR